MRWFVLLAVVLIISSLADARKKKKKGKKGGKRPSVNPGSAFALYTEAGPANCPCWWDLSKEICGCCKFGAVQCGFPKHKYCYKPSRYGCPGVREATYTLSEKGHPCHYDHKDRSCAWCAEGGYQCGKKMGGQVCFKGTDQRYCESMLPDCGHIGKDICDVNAECKINRKFGDQTLHKCECKEGWSGNGIDCINDDTGDFSEDPNAVVEVEMTLTSDFMIEDPEDGEFPVGPVQEALFGAMKSLMEAGSVGCSSCQVALANVTAPIGYILGKK